MLELIPTKGGIVASLKGDIHMTAWIKEHNSIVTDQTVPVKLLPLIHEGDTVLDIGSNIGSHAVQYAQKVGLTGTVMAFEPFLESFCCLKVNTRDLVNVECRLAAVGDESSDGIFMELPHTTNFGMARISQSAHGHVPMIRIDDLYLERVNFCKIDTEGWEPNVIKGMMETLRRCKPILFIEINKSALAYFQFTPDDILKPLLSLGYVPEHYDPNAEQVDVLFIPTK